MKTFTHLKPNETKFTQSAKNLPDKADFLTNADPTIVLFTREVNKSEDKSKWEYGPWKEFARTEIIEDTSTPLCHYQPVTRRFTIQGSITVHVGSRH